MKRIYFATNGRPYSDFEAEDCAKQFLLNNKLLSICVSTENFILATRALVKERVCLHENIQILFENKKIQINEFGKLSEWPKGFCDHYESWLARLL